MNPDSQWTVPKWPFLAVFVLLNALAFGIVFEIPHPISGTVVFACVALVILGSVSACLPFILEYNATGKLIEVNAVGTVSEKLDDLKHYAEQISSATGQWAMVQDATRGNAEKTVTAAKEIAARMAEEIREFNDFQIKLNDTEKGALRLEVEKLRRAEGEWLQVVARILDHIFALHNAASRSGNVELAEQIGGFQNACREAARRVGVTPFVAAAGEKFDSQKYRAHGVENPPADALITETLAPGLTYQGRLVRPALVRLQGPDATPAEPIVAPEPVAEPVTAIESPAEPAPAKSQPADSGEFALEPN